MATASQKTDQSGKVSTSKAVKGEKDLAVEEIIKKYSAISVSAGFIPVPLLDLATLVGIQYKAIQEICKVHGQELNKQVTKSVVTTAISTLSANSVSRLGGSLLKIVPVVGGALSQGAFIAYSGASTYAIGHLFHRHFTSGGTILDFDIKNSKESFKKLFRSYKSTSADTAAAA